MSEKIIKTAHESEGLPQTEEEIAKYLADEEEALKLYRQQRKKIEQEVYEARKRLEGMGIKVKG